MQIFNEIIHNKCIYIPFLLWLVIQIFKVVTELVKNKKLDVKRIVGAGGMPSSHSAIVCSIAVLVGKQYGFDTGIFALATVFAFIVMYDATGVRRAAGKQARILNKILETPGLTTVEVQEKLIEALGHTPIQVFVGAALGIIVGAIF
ncbi:MAG: divergent PAP2 family protein [Clostridia bacterium]|nr:divergent PAP2 family protein [Clostridia bacterium]